MIIVIGYGTFGRKVVNNTKAIDKISVIDSNAVVFESVEEAEFNFIVGDATDETILNKAGIKDADTVIVLTNERETNKKIAKLVSKLNPKAYLIVRNIVQYPDLYSGIEVHKIIYPVDCAAHEILLEIEKSKLRRKLIDLEEIVKDIKKRYNSKTSNIVPSKSKGEKYSTGSKDNNVINGIDASKSDDNKLAPCLIIMHNNPDPDSIASAMALKTIMMKWGVSSDIAYGGKIGFDENKAMVNLLGVKLTPIDNIDISNYEGVAVVDTSSSKIIPIDTTYKIDILLDHHNNGDLTANYMDIRPDIGATATILTEYLSHLNIVPKQKLATALYYAICTDTNYFKRKTSKKDFDAAGYLQDLMDPKTLDLIENPDMDTESMEALARAITNRNIIKNNIALSYVGHIKNRDALPKAADFLLKMEGITTTYVFGISENKIHISARTKDLRIDIGEIMRTAFGGGGHQSSAATSIDLGIFESVSDKKSLKNLVEEAIKTRILEAMGIDETDSTKKYEE
ncbi:TrkA-N domain protein [Methanococcus aeolicus Nankai-3]|uniref:TrkA-N domain protein n=1 Tax=Methanococcus aeolicus (strain ATCC BAA-1280 / DSM 17508 / OCM 812 / Nankai-3) TaxID=419665 RepID=A6UVF9_META3|nr:DHH family phosphoesterase [Methanococcus aeolicus]ABR56481.1 TrkA-N domain protein [Methanococcus aeolicus Nankai-3]